MLFSMDELTKPVTAAEVQASIYRGLGLVGVNTTSWRTGAVVRTMVVVTSIVIAGFSTLQSLIAKSGFLELAEKDWLDIVAWYVYRVLRPAATFASGEVTLTNAGGGVYSMDPGDLIVANPITGKTYRNIAAFTLNATSSLTISVAATEEGSASTAPPGTITEFVTTMLGVSVTNEFALVGADKATDPQLRTLCYEKTGSLSPMGPSDAYSYAAKHATRADGTRIGVNRTKVLRDGYGNVEVVCSTATGGVTGTLTNPVTDLGRVQLALLTDAEALAVTTTASSATPAPLNVTYQVWVYSDMGLTDAELIAQILARLTTFVAGQPIGGNYIPPGPGKVYKSALEAVIGATRPEIFRTLMTGSDVELDVRAAPVIGTVTCIAVHRYSREVYEA